MKVKYCKDEKTAVWNNFILSVLYSSFHFLFVLIRIDF